MHDRYAASANPPVLHRQEAFLHSEHPLDARFPRLTQQEERHGLLDDSVGSVRHDVAGGKVKR